MKGGYFFIITVHIKTFFKISLNYLKIALKGGTCLFSKWTKWIMIENIICVATITIIMCCYGNPHNIRCHGDHHSMCCHGYHLITYCHGENHIIYYHGDHIDAFFWWAFNTVISWSLLKGGVNLVLAHSPVCLISAVLFIWRHRDDILTSQFDCQHQRNGDVIAVLPAKCRHLLNCLWDFSNAY